MKRWVLLVVLAVLLAGCDFGKPLVTKPFFIDEVEMIITSVTTADTYESYKPSSYSDTFLIINANVLSKPDTVEVTDLDIMGAASLSGYWGRVDEASISRTSGPGGESLGTVEWVFVVPRHARSFTLELIGGRSLVLGPLLFFRDDTPFYIDEVEMVITSYKTAVAYGDIKPTSEKDTLLVIYADVLSKPKTVELEDLDLMAAVSLSGERFLKQPTWAKVIRGSEEGRVMWVFEVPRTARSFKLLLADGKFLVLLLLRD